MSNSTKQKAIRITISDRGCTIRRAAAIAALAVVCFLGGGDVFEHLPLSNPICQATPLC